MCQWLSLSLFILILALSVEKPYLLQVQMILEEADNNGGCITIKAYKDFITQTRQERSFVSNYIWSVMQLENAVYPAE